MPFDVIILGLGAMGSAAAYHLARRGNRVLGIEQFTSPHDKGSSHGGSRMIRQAYFESPDYIPLVLRAYELWRKLETDTGTQLLHITGGMNIGSVDGSLVTRTIAAAKRHSIPFDVLEEREIGKRFPVVVPQPGDVAVYEKNAGYLFPEECIRAHLKLAASAGAQLLFEESALSWSAEGDHVEVRTSKGVYSAGHLVITAGPWANQSLQGLFPLRVTRQVMAWIQPRGGVAPFLSQNFPVFLCEDIDGGAPAYGFPAIDGPSGGIKAAIHGSDIVCTPETVDRSIHASDIQKNFPATEGSHAGTGWRVIASADVPLHHVARRTLCDRSTSSVRVVHGCVRLFWAWFQVCQRGGRDTRGPGNEGTTAHPIALFSPERFTV